jgi:hypothetical protein
VFIDHDKDKIQWKTNPIANLEDSTKNTIKLNA